MPLQRIYHGDAYDTTQPVGSYWEAAVQDVASGRGALEAEIRADLVVIGAGYTGLNAALRFGAGAVVLDAGQVGWGASGRNAGFCGLGGGKLSDRAYQARHGAADLAQFYRAQVGAVDHVRSILKQYSIDAEVQDGGEVLLAHRPKDYAGFNDDAVFYERMLGASCRIIASDDLVHEGIGGAGFHGGLQVPVGFGLNPRRYVFGLARAVEDAGVQIYCDTPAVRVERMMDGRFEVVSPKGRVIADRLILAANGYNSEDVPDWMRGRYLPVVSHIMVTEPMGPDVLAAQGWTSHKIAVDTRKMLHYFRLLPDGRMLFGMRGTVNLGPKDQAAMPRAVRAHFDAMFPEWRGVKTDFHHSGLICVTRNLVPYVGPVAGWDGAFTAFGYHGGGVAMASYCGKQVAGMAMGRDTGDPLSNAMRAPLRRYPFARLRRWGLPAAFKWYGWQDR